MRYPVLQYYTKTIKHLPLYLSAVTLMICSNGCRKKASMICDLRLEKENPNVEIINCTCPNGYYEYLDTCYKQFTSNIYSGSSTGCICNYEEITIIYDINSDSNSAVIIIAFPDNGPYSFVNVDHIIESDSKFRFISKPQSQSLSIAQCSDTLYYYTKLFGFGNVKMDSVSMFIGFSKEAEDSSYIQKCSYQFTK